jgi:hypothetical protein
MDVHICPSPNRKEGNGIDEILSNMLNIGKINGVLFMKFSIPIDGILKEKAPPPYDVEDFVPIPLLGVIMEGPRHPLHTLEIGWKVLIIGILEMGGLKYIP